MQDLRTAFLFFRRVDLFSKISIRLCLIISLVLLTFSAAYAELFHFVDRNGVVHFSNAPTDPRYKPFKGKRLASYETNRYSEKDFNKIIDKKSKNYKIDPALVRAVIKAESSFDPEAVSYAGAQGLMQLMPVTAVNLDVINPFDPEENIEGGVRYLKYLMNLFKNDIKLALAAYHAGEQNVFKHNGIPPIPQTTDYVRKVLNFYKEYGGKIAPKEKVKTIYKGVSNDGNITYTHKPELYKDQQIYLISRKDK